MSLTIDGFVSVFSALAQCTLTQLVIMLHLGAQRFET